MIHKIDVLMPVKRVDTFFELAVQSILESKEVDVRLILIDDTDGSKPIPMSEDSRIMIVTTGGVGYSKAIQAGLECVSSPFIAFQDSDDLSTPNRLIKQVELLKSQRAEIANCFMLRINEKGRPKVLQLPDLSFCSNKSLPLLLGSYGANSTWVTTSEVIKNNRLFDFSSESLDWNSALFNFTKLKITTYKSPGYLYRIHKKQMTGNSDYRFSLRDSIYPAWLELNTYFNLPVLAVEEYQSVAFPYGGSIWTLNSNRWAREFLKKFVSLNIGERRCARAVLGQRFIVNALKLRVRRIGFFELSLSLSFFFYLIRLNLTRILG